MERFGWTLKSRQEIHSVGDAYGRPSWIGSGYVITTRVDKYVKLHFSRSTDFPRLGEIREIEASYRALPFPAPPALMWPLVAVGFCSIGVLIGLSLLLSGGADAAVGFGPLAMYGIPLFFSWRWLKRRLAKRPENEAICRQSAVTAEELMKRLETVSS